MGRPPLGKRPMTPAQVQKRYRRRKRQAAAVARRAAQLATREAAHAGMRPDTTALATPLTAAELVAIFKAELLNGKPVPTEHQLADLVEVVADIAHATPPRERPPPSPESRAQFAKVLRDGRKLHRSIETFRAMIPADDWVRLDSILPAVLAAPLFGDQQKRRRGPVANDDLHVAARYLAQGIAAVLHAVGHPGPLSLNKPAGPVASIGAGILQAVYALPEPLPTTTFIHWARRSPIKGFP